MRIVKKERVDIKKFMEQMRNNQSHRSYPSLDSRPETLQGQPQGQQVQRRGEPLYGNFSKTLSDQNSYPREYIQQGSFK